ncbi:MAG: translation elongation factor Ts [Treponema sp. CETP13]|nr:MAG: translation elongation factor Ts [Treponema sp. CETP13]
MNIKAADVKALREKTGAGMMDCKKALVACNGDEAEAVKFLKEKGLAAVSKRADKETLEGRIFVKNEGSRTVMLELTCETDFVANNKEFIALGESICTEALAKGYTEVNENLEKMIEELQIKIRENMSVKRLVAIDVPTGSVLSSYVHSDAKTGVLVLISTDSASAAEDDTVKQFAYDCCLHIAAFMPAFIKEDDVDEKYIAEQKEIFMSQVADMDKPDNVKQGIVKGKLKKHLASICFMDQPFVKDDKVSVAKKLEQIAKETNAKLTLEKVVSFQLGQ